ncbi:hypothetical protein CQ046_21895 [Chryseobacterium sp. MYb7]|jgi:hypothetical protein|uniref:hypothetical protein n=1 Tax=Chryseobacterium sp. MYb7 TaxID=1827290 RepID=UPI000D000655|nr:hypothetical protein [Chryseobacterium sp. MYb7]PRA95691.1 hypothetical protein CQ046_21895 [Chryseobacterium sp. MYb7]
MKKTLFVISSLFFVGCASSNDMLYTQDEEQSLNLKETLPSVSNKMLALNGGEITLMDLDLNKTLIQPSGGGCSFETGYNIDNIYTSTAAFGPNPLTFFGYTIRGYGMPRTDGFLWKGIRLQAENIPATVFSRGQSRLVNNLFENALSIEFPFEPNATYEITLKSFIEDIIRTEKHDQYRLNDDNHNPQQSEAFPIVAVELANVPEIIGNDPCAKRPVLNNRFVSANYYKTQKAEIVVPPSSQQKTFVFNFSTTEAKNAFILYYLPERGSDPYIPESFFGMHLTGIRIIKKPFDPTHVVPPRVTNPDPSLPCGFRGGC